MSKDKNFRDQIRVLKEEKSFTEMETVNLEKEVTSLKNQMKALTRDVSTYKMFTMC